MKWLENGWKIGALLLVTLLMSTSHAASRVIRVEGTTLAPGETKRVRVVLESLGDEKALGFNLGYNPAVLRFVNAAAGADSVAVGATLRPNPNQTTNFGRLGVTLSLDFFTTNTFPAGTNFIADIFFTPAAGVTGGVSAITFTNEPGVTEISDPNANELSATYVGSSVSVVLQCGFSLGSSAANFSDVGGAGSVSLVASHPVCAWSLVNTNPWLNLTSATNGAGSATVEFLVDAHPDLTGRTGTVVIAGQNFTVTQSGITCTYALAPGSGSHGPGAETNSFNVLAADPCVWSVGNTNAWVTILSGASGSGNGAVAYAVADNFSASPRAGTLVIAGLTFNILQDAFPCAYALSSTNAEHTAASTTNSFSITTSNFCAWSVVNTNPWINLLSGDGSGDGTVTYAVSANESLAGRSGALVVGGEIFNVAQQPVVCGYGLSPTDRVHASGPATDTISVLAPGPCPWSAVNTNPWINLLTGSNGAGDGVITYSLAANPTALTRTGLLEVAGQTFVLAQQGVLCAYALSPTRRSHGPGANSNFFTVQAASGCLWTVNNTNPWIQLLGDSGDGTNAVGYLIEANPAPLERLAWLTVDSATLIITQRAGASCTYELTPVSLAHGSSGGTGTVSIATGAGCAWDVTTTDDWIQFTSVTNGTGVGSFDYSLLANWGLIARTGTVFVAGQALPVTQEAYTGGFVFHSINATVPGEVSLSITGGPLGVWELQISGDLSNWSRLADLTNTTGRVDFAMPAVESNRFYRAFLP